uniref:Uncharacterized protein LOC100175027 n=1 Tax=Phallusia mammillata TaxID=59560 RepID=A0A6F9DGT7_9ASCI|nr:uncharacterized protein LOC100175027 [Phallusia mammillata]
MAYNGMVRKTVVFTNDDLEKVKLVDVNIQDFVIEVALCPRLFEGDKVIFYFMHQTLQEMFAAVYICMAMPESQFNEIIHQVIHESHWSMVRHFICGFLLGDDHKDGEEKGRTTNQVIDWGLSSMFTRILQRRHTDKRETFHNMFVKFVTTSMSDYQLIDVLTDVQECSDDNKDTIAKIFPVWFNFGRTPITCSTAHALGQILPRLNRPVERLNLYKCNLNLDSLNLICKGIMKLTNKIKFLDLSYNKFEVDEVRTISGCLNKVRRLELVHCNIFRDGVEILCQKMKPMELLNLSDNKFGDDGVIIISGCLHQVRWLELLRCDISATGLEVLCEKIKHLEIPMDILNLSFNEFNNHEVKIISGCLNKVRMLKLFHCKISEDGKQILGKELERLELPLSTIWGLGW